LLAKLFVDAFVFISSINFCNELMGIKATGTMPDPKLVELLAWLLLADEELIIAAAIFPIMFILSCCEVNWCELTADVLASDEEDEADETLASDTRLFVFSIESSPRLLSIVDEIALLFLAVTGKVGLDCC
jgi:hypothetical protein